MTVRKHKIFWSKESNSLEQDLDFEVIDVDCFVERVGHPCLKWAINEAWFRVSIWLTKKGAIITLGEPNEVEDKKIKTMTKNEMLSKAIALAAKVFDGHMDKGGHPYILHCLWVMDKQDKNDPERMAAAVLHDVVEDFKITKITIRDLMEMGFSDRIVRIVGILSHDKENVSYMDYVKGTAIDKDARPIKMADLEHNTQVSRLKGLGKKDFDRLEKYFTAYEYLKRV